MLLEDYFNFLGPDDIRLKGTRVGIETVLYDHLYRARTPEEIVRSYPSLTLEQVYATILYYHHEQEKVKAYLTEWLEWSNQVRREQENDPAHQAWMARLREARTAMRAREAALVTSGERR